MPVVSESITIGDESVHEVLYRKKFTKQLNAVEVLLK